MGTFQDLVGSTDSNGNTGTILAMQSLNSAKVIRWLHQHGDPIDRANHSGRTPLMEAALWRRLDSVRYLVENLPPAAIDVRDSSAMRALDLAAFGSMPNGQRNEKEKENRSIQAGRPRIFASPPESLLNVIMMALRYASSYKPGHESTAPQGPPPVLLKNGQDGKMDVYVLQEALTTPLKSEKTIGVLYRGPDHDLVYAMSGYTHSGWPKALDNREWTEKAQVLRRYLGLGYDLDKACHAEPQLLAYLLEKHSEQMIATRTAAVLGHNLPTTTTVNRPPCKSCREFIKLFEFQFSGFNIRWVFSPKPRISGANQQQSIMCAAQSGCMSEQ